MKTDDDIDRIEKLMGQLKGYHAEISMLAKKSPNDAVNKFKLGLINKSLAFGKEVLGQDYLPIDDFEAFDIDDVPSNSDVTTVLAQYIEEAERYRGSHIQQVNARFYYVLKGKTTDRRADPPTWSKKQ